MTNNQRNLLIIVASVLLLACMCVTCVALIGTGAFFTLRTVEDLGGEVFIPTGGQEAQPTAEVVRGGEPASTETLEVLANTYVPENNPTELAARLQGIHNVPLTDPAPDYDIGDQEQFWVTDTGNDFSFEVTMELRYESDLVYFWVEDGVSYDEDDLRALMRAFEEEMVPVERAFFGSEWNPGIDEDPHIYILYVGGVGFNTAGYFSSSDELHPMVSPYSNSAELFVLNADNQDLADPYAYGVLAHEFQHMIHWYRDRNEESWVNEGLSELASLLTGYGEGSFADLYTSRPDLQLNHWPGGGDSTPHYGSSFLFFTYFLERFGDEATQALVADDANGLESVDRVLAGLGEINPITGQAWTADDIVLDWMITNYLADGVLEGGRFNYNTYPEVLTPARPTETVNDCSPGPATTRSVNQYGVDYIAFNCDEAATLRFEGSTVVPLLPANAYSGSYAYWSNRGDESDMTLTRSFDFSQVEGPLTLSYMTWFDIEADWDYVYLSVSENGGEDWTLLDTPDSTDSNPNGNNYGSGITGYSGGGDPGEWIEHNVDLSAFAGEEVMLRFEYVTDASVNGEGFMVDDITIEAIDYFTDFESDHGGWEAAGFARVTNVLPQAFRLALIYEGDSNRVEFIEVPADNLVDIPLDFSDGVDRITLVVTGITRYTLQDAGYGFSFLP